MKKISIIFVFILTITSYHNVIFASYNSEEIEKQMYEEVDRIFQERTRIWNAFLIGQYPSIDYIEKDLKLIIGNPLLKTDLDMFQQILSNATSYEKINNVSIKDIKLSKVGTRQIKLETLIFWEVECYEESYFEEVRYKVNLEEHQDKWVLVGYDLSK